PVLNVEPRMYRFRVLDGSQARFYNLFFSTSNDPNTARPLSSLPFFQIGTDDGLLPNAVAPTGGYLRLAPGERDDVVVDFSQFAGQTIYLLNNAPAPFPSGDPANYDPRTVGRIMAFKVSLPKSKAPDVVVLRTKNLIPALSPQSATTTRDLALFETT